MTIEAIIALLITWDPDVRGMVHTGFQIRFEIDGSGWIVASDCRYQVADTGNKERLLKCVLQSEEMFAGFKSIGQLVAILENREAANWMSDDELVSASEAGSL